LTEYQTVYLDLTKVINTRTHARTRARSHTHTLCTHFTQSVPSPDSLFSGSFTRLLYISSIIIFCSQSLLILFDYTTVYSCLTMSHISLSSLLSRHLFRYLHSYLVTCFTIITPISSHVSLSFYLFRHILLSSLPSRHLFHYHHSYLVTLHYHHSYLVTYFTIFTLFRHMFHYCHSYLVTFHYHHSYLVTYFTIITPISSPVSLSSLLSRHLFRYLHSYLITYFTVVTLIVSSLA